MRNAAITRAEWWVKEYCVEPEIWSGASNLHSAAYLMRDLLKVIDEMESQVEYNESREFDAMRKLSEAEAALERMRAALAEYRFAKINFDENRLNDDSYAWKERYQRLLKAEQTLINLTGQALTGQEGE